MSKYLITGGAGFIGSHLTNRLLNDGHEVIVVDDLSTGFRHYLPEFHKNLLFLKADISKWEELVKYSANFKDVECVFHLSAKARIQPSIYNPTETHDVNTTGTFNVLQLMKLCGIKNIVYSASSSYYGTKAKIPSLETDPPDCQTPYALSKYVGELYCSTWSKVYEINSVRLRYFNVWGPRSPIGGSYDPVVSLFFRQALDKKTMTIVGDGAQRRDFTPVTDVVEANIKAAHYMQNNKKIDETFNIGTGKNYSILELANMVKSSIKKVCDLPCEFVFIPERIGEAKESLANNEKAKQILGWQPQNSLETKIDELRDYYLNGGK